MSIFEKKGEVAHTSENVDKIDKKVKGQSKKTALIGVIIGVVVIAVGVVVALMIGNSGDAMSNLGDAEYLVEVGSWQREDAPNTIWSFINDKDGAFTADNHGNDYYFTWEIDTENGVIKVKTAWLDSFDGEYKYELNRSDKKLTLSKDEEEMVFVEAEGDKKMKQEENTVEESTSEDAGTVEESSEGEAVDVEENNDGSNVEGGEEQVEATEENNEESGE